MNHNKATTQEEEEMQFKTTQNCIMFNGQLT